ncbi:efflux RND transporter periplasmic adaptor subunit [Halosquirtibacter xylanolyticus]|uniref:efflux RND transporter periplasmic adaptor subunit n=1 Tax=Halosquirtibacter xylanolyticus TaxID=3374599 RepID=UPI00374863B0|nr:efflux RND transporter periplasmic adaptor subunit [Prolixibacteraceae bacterium]
MKRYTLLMITLLGLIGCRDKQSVNMNTTSQEVEREVAVPVDVTILKRQSFHETFSYQGVVYASEKITISAPSKGTIHYHQTIGSTISKGAIIAEITSPQAIDRYDKAKLQVDRCSLEYKNKMMGLVGMKDEAQTLEAQRHSIALQVGLLEAQKQFDICRREKESLQIRAPFDGQISQEISPNLQEVEMGTKMFEYIPNKAYEVTFKILESDLPKLHKGDALHVVMLSTQDTLHGKLLHITPKVDTYGFISLTGEIMPQNNQTIMDGMHAMVEVYHTIPNQIVLPKEAVLRRGGKRIVFIKKGPEAHWKYIDIIGENANSLNISKGVEQGDSLIVSNCVNLAHHSDIVLEKVIELKQ